MRVKTNEDASGLHVVKECHWGINFAIEGTIVRKKDVFQCELRHI